MISKATLWWSLILLLTVAAVGGWFLRSHFANPCCTDGGVVDKATGSDIQAASSLGERSSSAPKLPSRGGRGPAIIYQAKSLSSVEALAASMGPGSPDALAASTATMRMCNYLVNSNGKISDETSLFKYGRKENVDFFVAERQRFCEGKVDGKYVSAQSLEDGLPDLYQASSDPTVKQLLDIKYGTNDAPQDVGQQKQALSNILKSTQSPFELQEAGDLLSTKFGSDWTGGDIEKDFGESSDSQKVALSSAIVLASCDIFGGCGPGDWKTLQYCMPFECSSSTTVESYLRSRLNGSEFDRAQQFARQIQQWRADP